MRKTCLLAICLMLLVGCSVPVATSYGKVVYALTVDKSPSGKADVYEKDLDSGKVSVIIPHEAFPKKFKGYVSYLSISPDGCRLMIGERLEPFEGNTIPANYAPKRLWIWTRESKTLHLALSEVGGMFPGWSPNARHFAVFDWKTILSYDVDAGTVRTIEPPEDCSDTTWSASDASLILVSSPEGGVSTVYEQPLDGTKPRVLFRRWSIESVTQSPDRSGYAVAYPRSIDLVNANGGRLHRTPIRPDLNKGMSADLCFSRTGEGLAVLMSYSYGEPSINTVEQLWSVESKTGKSVRLAAWSECVQPEFSSAERHVEGWSSDGRSILIDGTLSWDSILGYRSDWHQLWAYDIDGPKGKGSKLLDSGHGCTGFTWWDGS